MKKLLFTLITFLFAGSLLSAQTTVDLRPDMDAALGIHDGTNTSNFNYGNVTHGSAYCIPAASGSGENKNRALLHFDLSQFAPGTQIQSATLDLHAFGPSGVYNGHTGTLNSAVIQPVTNAWQEMVVTWNSQPSYSSLNNVSLAASTNPLQDYLGINVTAMVQNMIDNPSTNFGMGLMLQQEVITNLLLFASRENPDSALHPMLHVTTCKSQFVLVATDDAALGTHDGQGTSGNNYSVAPQCAAYSVTATNGTASGNNNRALMHFDLSSINPTANVTSAKLALYARGPNGNAAGHIGTANECMIARVTQPWSANTVTWDNQPTMTTTDAAILAQSTNPLQDYLNIDVTAMVQGMVDGSLTNDGFMLRLVNEIENNGLIFQSLDCGNPAQFPTLTVEVSCGDVTAVEQPMAALHTARFYPNPAVHALKLQLDLATAGNVTVQLHDLSGRLVGQVDAGMQAPGMQTLELDELVQGKTPGIYLARVMTGNTVMDSKLVLQNP